MIRRAPRPEGNFVILNKAITEDRRLSWAARGLLVFLLGKPDHWQVSTGNLISETSDSGAPLSRDGVRGLYNQLIQAGYMRRLGRVTGEDGRFSREDYEVTENPWPMTESAPRRHRPLPPGTGLPGPVKPAPAKTPQVSTDPKQGLKPQARNDRSRAGARERPAKHLEDALLDF
jgi:hypothetical protein